MSEPIRSLLRGLAAVALTGLALVLLGSLGGCAPTRLAASNSFPETVQLYRSASDTRAMAVAAEGTRRTWGVAYAPTQSRANEDALEECRRNAQNEGIQAPCWLFAETTDAPAATVAGCRAGRISPERCAIQDKYGPRPAN